MATRASDGANDRARELAARFREMNDGVIRFAAGCSAADWRRMVPNEGRSVAYLIAHIAFGYRLERRAVLAFASGEAGQPPVYTMEDLAASRPGRNHHAVARRRGAHRAGD
mgnify:CR=1 FL=1